MRANSLGITRTRASELVRADVNFGSGTASVAFDETRTSASSLRAAIEACGYHCAGEQLPRHVCEPRAVPGELIAPVVSEHPAPHALARDVTAHEMGHGTGGDMAAMVRDMRNRFWVCLAFTILINLYSPMGGLFTPPGPPLGLALDEWLFVLGTLAVVYPSWPFVVAAWRALRSGVLNMAVLVVQSVGVGYLFSVGATFFYTGAAHSRPGRARHSVVLSLRLCYV